MTRAQYLLLFVGVVAVAAYAKASAAERRLDASPVPYQKPTLSA